MIEFIQQKGTKRTGGVCKDCRRRASSLFPMFFQGVSEPVQKVLHALGISAVFLHERLRPTAHLRMMSAKSYKRTMHELQSDTITSPQRTGKH